MTDKPETLGIRLRMALEGELLEDELETGWPAQSTPEGVQVPPERAAFSRLFGVLMLMSEHAARVEEQLRQLEASMASQLEEARRAALPWRLATVALGCAVAGLWSWVLLAG